MGIDGIQGEQNRLQVERQYSQPTGEKERSSLRALKHEDQVQLSDETQELIRVKALVDASPDIRMDRVEQLRAEIARGTYNVTNSEIADAILDTWI